LTKLGRPARNKHSSFLQTFVNYCHKICITMGPEANVITFYGRRK
jgi:hypothetical protein